jgi:16S rRNA (adenine(1408)-N(1))-methyltransferase
METIDIVRGRTIIRTDGTELRAHAAAAARVLVDIGTGDGRYVYRVARANPTWLCIGIDANAEVMRGSSYRASRKPSRGGAGNAVYVRAALDALPRALDGIADEITVLHPWGSLLDAVTTGEGLARVARIGKPAAQLVVIVNRSAMRCEIDTAAYARAGLLVQRVDDQLGTAGTTWGARLASTRPMESVVITATMA